MNSKQLFQELHQKSLDRRFLTLGDFKRLMSLVRQETLEEFLAEIFKLKNTLPMANSNLSLATTDGGWYNGLEIRKIYDKLRKNENKSEVRKDE